MNLSDTHQRPAGIFDLQIWRRGELVESYCDHNLIVDVGRNAVTLLIGGDGAGLSVTKIGFGTGATPADPSNTSLTSGFIKAVDAHSYPTQTSVSFQFSLLASEANGLLINEFGLITASGALFARKVRTAGPLTKDNDLALSGSWTLLY